MPFTSWSDIRTQLKDALSDYVAGAPITKEYTIGGRKHQFRDVQEIKALITLTYEMEALENSGNPENTVSYGRYER
jgi:hypothetical protein